MLKNKNLSRIADDLVGRADKFQALRDIANRKNYPHKIKQLHIRISEEFEFWNKKDPSAKLLDLKKDCIFIESQLTETNLNKVRIDELCTKYNIGYDKDRNLP
jgi:hypothetical protein